MVTVVAPENYNGRLGQTEIVEFSEDSAELLVGVAERGIVGSALLHHLANTNTNTNTKFVLQIQKHL